MNNNYDQILREKLQGVNSTPPAGLWSKIEASLPSAEATAAFDQAVKGKVANVVSNPPPGLWSKIGAAIHSVPFYKTAMFKWSAAAVLLISAFIGWELLDNSQEITPKNVAHQNAVEIPANLKTQNTEKPISQNSSSHNSVKPISSDKVQTKSKKTKAGILLGKSVSKNTKTEVKQSVNITPSTTNQKNTVVEKYVVTSSSDMDNLNGQHQMAVVIINGPVEIKEKEINELAVQSQKLYSDTLESGNINDGDNNKQVSEENPSEVIAEENNSGHDNKEATNLIEDNNETEVNPGALPRNPRNLNKFGIQINYTPSYVNTSVNIIDKQDFSLSLAYQNLNFVADLGFGLGFSSEKNAFTIDYLHYEFVKTQFVTDSLSFVFDPNTQTFVPVAVGHQEKVYDDVKYSFSSEVTTNYTYINIPFNAGYIKEFKYFDLMAKGGINYSMIISKTEKGGFVPDEHTTIVSKDYSARTRFQSNITYSLAFGGAINLHNNLKLTGEIIGGYYQNSVYTNIDYRPYSYGVRFGLIYFVQ